MFRPIDKVILHCSDTPDYTLDKLRYDYRAADVDAWHKKRGWSGIGYHYFIPRGGDIETGRDLSRVGAHTIGQNKYSIGVCYAGRKQPTEYQIFALEKLGKDLHKRFGITSDNWFGHRDFTDLKDCPGFDIVLIRAILKSIGV